MNGNVKAGGREEWFDVVNARDEVVSRALRREVHAKGLWHRAVHVLVFNAAGEIFLQKRSMLKDLSPGLWDSSCSGHLDAGEDYDAAAARELAEEIGVRVDAPPTRWFRLNACEETGWEFVWGLPVAARRTVQLATGGDRERRVDGAGGRDAGDRGAAAGLLPVVQAALAIGGGEIVGLATSDHFWSRGALAAE